MKRKATPKEENWRWNPYWNAREAKWKRKTTLLSSSHAIAKRLMESTERKDKKWLIKIAIKLNRLYRNFLKTWIVMRGLVIVGNFEIEIAKNESNLRRRGRWDLDCKDKRNDGGTWARDPWRNKIRPRKVEIWGPLSPQRYRLLTLS